MQVCEVYERDVEKLAGPIITSEQISSTRSGNIVKDQD